MPARAVYIDRNVHINDVIIFVQACFGGEVRVGRPAVPSCLLNNYGSILGPDNIDARRALAAALRARAHARTHGA